MGVAVDVGDAGLALAAFAASAAAFLSAAAFFAAAAWSALRFFRHISWENKTAVSANHSAFAGSEL